MMFESTRFAARSRVRLSPLAIAAAACLLATGSAGAYEEPTHTLLTQLALDRSVIGQNPALLTSFGLHDPTLVIFTKNVLGGPNDYGVDGKLLVGTRCFTSWKRSRRHWLRSLV